MDERCLVPGPITGRKGLAITLGYIYVYSTWLWLTVSMSAMTFQRPRILSHPEVVRLRHQHQRLGCRPQHDVEGTNFSRPLPRQAVLERHGGLER